MPLKNDELKWAGIDFDGVLCHSEAPDYEPTYPLKGAREAMEKLAADGWKITVYTARPWSEYDLVERWLNANQIPFRRIICGKPLLRFMIDDRNIEFDGDWKDALDKVNARIAKGA